MVRYLHPCSSSPTVQSNSMWTWKHTDWTALQYGLKRKLGKQEGRKNLTGRVQCVQVCVCAVAVDKCKVAATPKDNPVFIFRYCRNSYITQRYRLLKLHSLLQSWQRFFLLYLLSTLSNRVLRENREEMATRRSRWKVNFHQIAFLKDFLSGHNDTWHLPAPPQEEGSSACLGLAVPE